MAGRAVTRSMPRRLRVVHDFPRATRALGRPLLEAARLVPLRPLFPRGRAVADGRSHEDPAWWLRSVAHLDRRASERRRGVRS